MKSSERERAKEKAEVELSNKKSKLSIKLHFVVANEQANRRQKKHILQIFIIISIGTKTRG